MEKFGEKKLEEGCLEDYAEGRVEGRMEGHLEGMIDMARSLLTLNVPVEVIEKASGYACGDFDVVRRVCRVALMQEEVERLVGTIFA